MTVDALAIDPARKRKAWIMVWASMIGTMCCSTSVILVNVGIFMKPLSEAFGWGRGEIALSLSIAALAMAAANPFVGRLIDRFGVKPVLVSSLLVYAGLVALLPVMTRTGGLPGLYIGYGLIAALGAGSNVIAYVRLLSGWFSGPLDSSRGLALGLSSAGVPLGTMVAGPLAIQLISHFGWAGGYWGLALVPVLIGLPIAMFVLHSSPSDLAHTATAPNLRKVQSGMSFNEAMATPHFWIMTVVVLVMASCLQAMTIHITPFMSDLGISANSLTLVTALSGAIGMGGRVVCGFLFDRFFAPRVAIVVFALPAAAALLLIGHPGLSLAVGASVLINFGTGAESDFVGYLVGRYFGLRSYGQIFGFIYGMFMVGIAIGPYLFGVGYDLWHSYRIPFMAGSGGLFLLCALLFFLPRFKSPEGAAAEGPELGMASHSPVEVVS